MAIATSTIIALAAAAAAAGASYYNTEKTASNQDKSLAAEIQDQTAKQQQANQRVAQTVNQLKSSTPDAGKQASLAGYVDQLRQHARQIQGDTVQTGNVSDAYKKDAANQDASTQSFGSNIANLMANIDAPTLQRAQEGRDIGNMGIDLGTIANSAQGQNFVDQLRLRAIRRNPWLDAFSSIAGSYAKSSAGGMGGGGGGIGSGSGYGGGAAIGSSYVANG